MPGPDAGAKPRFRALKARSMRHYLGADAAHRPRTGRGRPACPGEARPAAGTRAITSTPKLTPCPASGPRGPRPPAARGPSHVALRVALLQGKAARGAADNTEPKRYSKASLSAAQKASSSRASSARARSSSALHATEHRWRPSASSSRGRKARGPVGRKRCRAVASWGRRHHRCHHSADAWVHPAPRGPQGREAAVAAIAAQTSATGRVSPLARVSCGAPQGLASEPGPDPQRRGTPRAPRVCVGASAAGRFHHG